MKSATMRLLFVVLMLSGSGANAGQIGHVELNQVGPVFDYTVFNDEPVGNSNYISTFSLSVSAPIIITSTPDGWAYISDNATYVDWFNTDPALPYPHDIAPGTSLGGFTIESTVTTSALEPYALTYWDHSLDAGGPSFQDQVLAPFSFGITPEPTSVIPLAIGITMLAGFTVYRRRAGTNVLDNN